MGSRLYFDCPAAEGVAGAAARVAAEIRKADAGAAAQPRVPVPVPDDHRGQPAGLATWSPAQVHAWLAKHALAHLQLRLGNRYRSHADFPWDARGAGRLDGRLLGTLRRLYSDKPPLFLAILEKLRITKPLDVLALVAALEEI